MPIDEMDIKLEHLPAYIRMHTTCGKNIDVVNKKGIEKSKRTEQDQIREALERNGGNITRAAQDLAISRQCLQHRIKKYHIK